MNTPARNPCALSPLVTRLIEVRGKGVGRWREILGDIWLALAIGCAGTAPQKSAEIGSGTDAGLVPVDGSGLGPPSDDGPGIVSVSVPSGAAGVIPLALAVADHRADRVDLAASVSLDQGATWKPAHLRPPSGSSATGSVATVSLPASGSGVTSTLSWDSVPDIGFHTPPSAWLRLPPPGAPGARPPPPHLAPPPPKPRPPPHPRRPPPHQHSG